MSVDDAQRLMKAAEDVSLRVVAEAGLTVQVGQTPTEHQARMAALHARQDAAMIAALLGMMIARDNGWPAMSRRAARVLWWFGAVLALPTFGLAALLLWPVSYVLAGSFWRPPPR